MYPFGRSIKKKGALSLILQTDGTKPIYIQISEWLETEILKENLKINSKVYSQYQLADMFTINPATAAKGLNVLADEEILYDKRGLGKFVSNEAITIIRDKRMNQTLKGLIQEIVLEAKYLDISENELLEMVKMMNQEIKEDEK